MVKALYFAQVKGEFGLLVVTVDDGLVGLDVGERRVQRRLADAGPARVSPQPGDEPGKAALLGLGQSRDGERDAGGGGEHGTALHQKRTDAASEPKLNSPDLAVRNSCVCQVCA